MAKLILARVEHCHFCGKVFETLQYLHYDPDVTVYCMLFLHSGPFSSLYAELIASDMAALLISSTNSGTFQNI